jgi:type VI secretion system protein ImpH
LANTRGEPAINIEQDILENGDAYDFYQAVKLLNKLVREKAPEQGSSPGLRIQPELNLDYPQSDIAQVSLDDASGNYQMTTTFFGLYGVSSPLPGFYTEELLDDEWDEYTARKDFFDVIHNHLYPLLYQAWLKYKLSHNVVEFSKQNYTEIIFSLIGLSEAYREDRKNFGYLLRYSGLLSQRTRSLHGLKTLLKDIVGDIGLDIRPCVKRMVPIVKEQRCTLGRQNATLGFDACIGKQVIDRSGKFNIEIGPLNSDQFVAFSRGNEAVQTIRSVLDIYLVQPLEFSISLLLEPGTVKPASVGVWESAVLGTNCWLTRQTNKTTQRVDLVDTKTFTAQR